MGRSTVSSRAKSASKHHGSKTRTVTSKPKPKASVKPWNVSKGSIGAKVTIKY